MLLEITGEIIPEWKKRWSQSKNNTQLLMWLVMEVKSNAVKRNIASAKSLQSCPTLCDPIDGSPTGSTVPGILQARTLEWVAISFPNAWKWKVKVKSLSRVWPSVTPWTAAYQAPLSMGFSRQEYWSGVPLPSPEYCIGTWSVRSINQGKLEVVKLETARLNIDLLGISELKWTGMG